MRWLTGEACEFGVVVLGQWRARRATWLGPCMQKGSTKRAGAMRATHSFEFTHRTLSIDSATTASPTASTMQANLSRRDFAIFMNLLGANSS